MLGSRDLLSALQNASSRLTLVLCPAITTERLTMVDFMSVSPMFVVSMNHRNRDFVICEEQVSTLKKNAEFGASVPAPSLKLPNLENSQLT